MKILWVNTGFLHPTTKGGQIRTLEMLRRLQARHEVHYAAPANPEEPEGPARAATALEMVSANFSWERIVTRFEEILRRI